jgi:PAS domain S-box-containing protein
VSLLRFTRSLGLRQTMLLTAGCFILVALGVTGVALVSRSYARQGSQQTGTLTRQFLPGLVALARLQEATLNLKSITFQFALARDEAGMNAHQLAFDANTAQVNRCLDELTQLAKDSQTREIIAAFSGEVRRYRASSEQFQTELRIGAFEQAMATLDHQLDPAQKRIETQLHAIGERYFRLSHDASARTTALLEQSDRFGLLATIVLAGFTLLCLALSLAATRAMLAQIQRRDAERLAAHATLEKRVAERTADLRASEERIRLIVDTASDAIITFDAGGTITAWNAQAESLLGWPQAEILGRDLAGTVLLPAHREPHLQRIARFLASGDNAELRQRLETTLLHRDGRERPVEMTMSPVRLADGVLVSAFVRDIAARKQAEVELRQMHRQLLETSRQAGMAEVATGVLHNVGNALNSVNVSSTLIIETVEKSKAANLGRIAAMLQEHQADPVRFLTEDDRGRRIPGYIVTLSAELADERKSIAGELAHLRKNIEHIKDIVAMQQSYAKVSGVTEPVALAALVEDALRMNASALSRHGLEVVRDYQVEPVVTTERQKVLQVLVNLIRNAKYACDDSGREDKRLTVRLTQEAGRIRIVVLDNGVGIPPENLTRIFSHGFTTRKDGHGFGLHSGALVAKELGGSLTARSDGPGQGAAFTLEIPAQPGPATS